MVHFCTKRKAKHPDIQAKLRTVICTKSHSRKIKTLYQKFLFAPKGRPKPPEVYAILKAPYQKAGKNSINSSKINQKFW